MFQITHSYMKIINRIIHIITIIIVVFTFVALICDRIRFIFNSDNYPIGCEAAGMLYSSNYSYLLGGIVQMILAVIVGLVAIKNRNKLKANIICFCLSVFICFFYVAVMDYILLVAQMYFENNSVEK